MARCLGVENLLGRRGNYRPLAWPKTQENWIEAMRLRSRYLSVDGILSVDKVRELREQSYESEKFALRMSSNGNHHLNGEIIQQNQKRKFLTDPQSVRYGENYFLRLKSETYAAGND